MSIVTPAAPVLAESPGGPRRPRRPPLDREQRRSLLGMGGFVLLLHVVGWGTLLTLINPHHFALPGAQNSGKVFGIGIGLTAYVLGMRHAFDADHIAAIDNTTRKLMGEGKKPMSVGFWFSLGHSSVVFGMCAVIGFGVRAVAGQVTNGNSSLHSFAGVWGTLISGVFLLLIGWLNLVVLRQILGVFRRMRSGDFDESELEAHLDKRGVLNRVLGRVTRVVRKPWHMYPIGLLFGLGFDTVTEIGLFVIAGGAAAVALPWYAVLTLPVLFAAGMSLLDSIDGVFMNFAYGWAMSRPVRKVYYNITITALSVAVALLIGFMEIIGLVAQKLHITRGPLAAIGNVDLQYVGYGIVGLFAVTWAIAFGVWKYGRIEEKWSARLR
ncbi:MAG: nickel/cobalt transporter (NiCoT) family protein [Frankiaceae bacterium]|nr:nickel/cobalt transporter (NiCoT) family protein [Frankiaceae bacterium]